MNYRSVMAIGRTRPVTDPEEKDVALRALVDHIVPGRSDAVRGGDRRELVATAVLALPLDEVSAKVRTGPPKDDEPDYALPIWAGVLPWPSPRASRCPTRSSTRRSRSRTTWPRGPACGPDPRAWQISSVTPAASRRRCDRGRWVAATSISCSPCRRNSVASSGSATSTSPEARPASTSSAITRRARAKTSTSPNPASWNSTWCRAWLARAKSYEAATSRSTRAAVAPAPAGSGSWPSPAAKRSK